MRTARSVHDAKLSLDPLEQLTKEAVLAPGDIMAHMRKGQLATSPEWWRHLRWMKRAFWKRERQEGRGAIRRETGSDVNEPKAAQSAERG